MFRTQHTLKNIEKEAKFMKKLFALMCAAGILLTGCGKEKASNNDAAKADLSKYPIKTTQKLTYFKNMPSNLSGNITNYGETEYAKEFSKRTGVEIEYIHPAAGQFAESFNLMIASGEIADIIDASWFYQYAGGPGKAISDKIIIPLNDYKEYAPAYFAYLKSHPELDKHAKTDEKDYYGFPLILESEKMLITTGPTIRADWLKDLGLSVPETVEEWETMLKKFKEEKGAESPFSFNYSNETLQQFFLAMLGTHTESYLADGKIKYGAVQPEFKDALVTANKWFNEGLLDKNFVSADDKTISSQVLSGQTGASFLSGGREIGQFLKDGVKPSKEFDLLAVPFPSAVRGEYNSYVYKGILMNSSSSAISAQCKNPALAAKVLDYSYTDEGIILANYGIEGKSFNYVDGKPIYTDTITKNPDGLNMSQALGMYVRAGGGGGAFVNTEGYLDQYYALPQQKAALDQWSKLSDRAEKESLAWSLTPTTKESSEYARIMNEVKKYQAQMTIKFITGIEPLSNFDKYVETLNGYGLQRALEIQKAQYDRFRRR